MSELLEEARERRDKAELSTESPSYNWLNDSYYLGEQNAWQEAVDLIKKHEKPKGLMEYVRPPYWGLPFEFNLNFWRLKYDVRDIIQDDKSVEEMRWNIGQKFDKFHFAELDIELTEEQQGIYTELKGVYQDFCFVLPGDKDNAVQAICNTLENEKDHNAIPVLKKFISEVEE
ncbi:hypothetical protein [Tetragenococcus halophilus]|uniref:hypothetical protein n=1 Tax=Tetragenococcus halophilus TaxID=51669 RepID=UPI00209B19DF|nr:hypothetical protein [Tetragenococcus halophilus]MCO8292639.1 hypothetical protein [Tetragenococcus halophilus]